MTTNREYSEIGQAYIDLAEAIGVKYDPEDVEPYLRKFLTKLTNTAFEKAGERIGKLQANVTQLSRTVERVDVAAQEAHKSVGNISDRVRSLNHDYVFGNLENEVQEFEKTFEVRCAEIAKDYVQQLNPFHSATEDLLEQLARYDVPKETWAEPITTLINSMGYLQWQTNSKKKEDNEEDDMSAWVKRNMPRAR